MERTVNAKEADFLFLNVIARKGLRVTAAEKSQGECEKGWTRARDGGLWHGESVLVFREKGGRWWM